MQVRRPNQNNDLSLDKLRLGMRKTAIASVAATSLLLSGCGGGGGSSPSPAPAPAPAPAPTPSPAPAPTPAPSPTSGPFALAAPPKPTSTDHYKNVLAYANRVNVTAVSDPTLTVHTAYVGLMLGYGLAPDAVQVQSKLASAKASWTKSAGKTVGNSTQLALLAITAARDELTAVLGAKRSSLLAMTVQQQLLGASNASAGRGVLIADDEQGSQRRATVLEETALRCTADANAANLCNTVLKTRLGGVDVNNAYSATCTNSTEVACLVLANPPTTQAARDAHLDTVLRKVTSAAQSCAANDANCKLPTAKEQKAEETKKREEEAKKFENAGNTLAKYGQKYLGFSENDAAITQAFFTTSGKLYENIYAAASAYDTLKNVNLSQALTFNSILHGVIFDEKTNPKWIEGINLIDGVGGAIASVTGIVGAVMGVVKLFSSGKASAAQQQQAQQLMQAIDAMRKQLSSQLTAIDQKLDNVLLLSSDILSAVFASNASLSEQTSAAQRGLAQLQAAVETLSFEAQGWSQDSAASFFNSITGTEYTLNSVDVWLDQATSTKSWVTTTALDSTHAGPEGSFGDMLTEFSRPGTAWVNGLRWFPKVVGLEALAAPRASSPSDTVGVVNRWLFPLITAPQYRPFVEQKSAEIKRYLTSVRDSNFNTQVTLRREIQLNTKLMPAILTAYTNAANTLASKQDQAVVTWMTVNGPAGSRDVSSLNPWAGGAQALAGYTPRGFSTGSMAHCDGASAGAPLSLPDWKKVIPAADPSLTADALGAPLSLCYKITGTLAGGYTQYQWERVNDDHKQAFGAFTVQVLAKQGGKVVASRTVRFPETGLLCFADIPKSQVDTISNSRPAQTILVQAWEGSFAAGGVCSSTTVPSMSNIRDAFNASTVQSVSWSTSDPTARASVLASNERAVAALAVGVENYLADQTSLTGTGVADAARQLSGYKLAVRRYIEFGYPTLWRTNDVIRASFEGTNQLVDADEVQRQLRAAAITAAGTTRPAKFAFSADAIAKMDSVISLLNAYQAKIISGALVDDDVELLSIRTQLDSVLGSLE